MVGTVGIGVVLSWERSGTDGAWGCWESGCWGWVATGATGGAALLEALADTFDEVVVTVNSSPRSMPLEDLQELAVDVFGEERVHTAARMDEAIALAVDLTEDGADDMSGTGVVVTGSVVSAGDARTLTGMLPS